MRTSFFYRLGPQSSFVSFFSLDSHSCRLHYSHRRLVSCNLIWIFNLPTWQYSPIPFPESSFSAPFDLRTSNQLASAMTRCSETQTNQIVRYTHSFNIIEGWVKEGRQLQNLRELPLSWVTTGLMAQKRQEECRSSWDYQSKRLTA